MYEQYTHHGRRVWVRKDLRGKHRDHCLCWQCKKFTIRDLLIAGETPTDRERDDSCPIANMLYRIAFRENLVIPVYECPDFEYDDETPF